MMALALLVGVLLLEVGVRFYHWSQGRPLLASTSFLDRDPRLGWRPAGGLRVERVLADASGRSYRARVTTDRHGFRRAPEPAPGTPRILFLGDSFTHAVEVGDEHAYHAVFARRMPEYAVFAIGAGGYGPLQEALLLEEVYPRVEPDVVIWQLCTNDLTNSLFEAEQRSGRHNNLLRRPYLVRDSIVYLSPAPWPWRVLDDLYRVTGLRFLKAVQQRSYRLSAAFRGAGDDDGFGGPDGRKLRTRAVALAEAILKRTRRRHGRTRFLSFEVCGGADAALLFRGLSDRSGVTFLGSYRPAIAARRGPGFEVFARDGGHLNENGHALLGEMLAADFRKADLTMEGVRR